MISAINVIDRLALMESGEAVGLAFYDENKQPVDAEEDASFYLVGPYHEWTGKRFEKKYAYVEKGALTLLDPYDAN